MLGYLKGTIVFKEEEAVVIEAGGVGYRVFVSSETMEEMEPEEEAELYLDPYIRENKFDLYGLENEKQLSFFRFLASISGVGPRIGLSLVKYGSPKELKGEIEKKGEGFAKEVKGVGKKKLRKILLELTGKVKELEKGLASERKQARKALTGLGFSREEARGAVLEVPDETEDSEEVVEKALKILGDED